MSPALRALFFVVVAPIMLFAGTAHAEQKAERLSSPVRWTGATLVIAGGAAGVVGLVGFMSDGFVRLGKSWGRSWCFYGCGGQPTFDNTPRDVFGAMAVIGLGAAFVGGAMYVIGSTRVRVTPTTSGMILVEGSF